MIQITPQMKILVAIDPVDGRKGIDSLARLCQEKLETDPFSGCLFLFRSRRGTSIRLLVYDGQGFWLAQRDALKALQPLHIEQVRRTGDERLYNSLIEQHHYLGYEQPVGEHLKYMIWGHERPIACMAWSSAPRHLGCRDRFIGWTKAARRRNIRFIA